MPDHLPLSPPGSMLERRQRQSETETKQLTLSRVCPMFGPVGCPPALANINRGGVRGGCNNTTANVALPMPQLMWWCKVFPSTVKIVPDVKIAAALQATSPHACVMRFHAPGNFASSQLAPPPGSAQQCPPNRLHQEGGKRVR